MSHNWGPHYLVPTRVFESYSGVVELRESGMFPDVYATLTIDEYHVYFHTQHAACMLFNPTWYSGRAFKAVEEGGQDPNWHSC